MTAVKKETRAGYEAQVVKPSTVYVRRAHPKDPPELVIGWGRHDCTIIPLDAEWHKALLRDLHYMYFGPTVLA